MKLRMVRVLALSLLAGPWTVGSALALSEEGAARLLELRAKAGLPVVEEKTGEPSAGTPAEAGAPADVLTMKNGDRLSGLLLRVAKDTFVMKAYGNAEISVPAKEVVTVTTVGRYRVTLVGGSALDGSLSSPEAGRVAVLTEVGPVTADLTQVAAVDDFAELAERQRLADEAARFALGKVWSGKTSLGFTNVSGNSTSNNVAVSMEATRKTVADKIFLDARYNRSTAAEVVSADVVRAGMRVDVNLSPKIFYFLFGRMEIDKVQDLDMRTTVGAGLGRTFYDGKDAHLDLGFGATYNRDSYEALPTESEATFLTSLNWNRKMGRAASFSERLLYYPQFSDMGDYRVESETKIDYFLDDNLSLNFTVLDRYDSSPKAGNEANDLTVTTGLTKRF